MATVELADFDEQLDEIISEHKVKKSKEKRLLRKRELKSQNVDKISSLKNEKLIRKSNQIFADQLLKLFHENYFCDLIIEDGDQLFKYLHSFILIARVPVLFELLKERFIVENDTSTVPVLSSATAHSNPLYDNLNCLKNSDCTVDLQEKKVINSCFLHIRLPAEVNKIFNLIGFLQNIYSESDCVESQELELIILLDKIKVLEDQNLFTLENLLNLNCNLQDQPMNESPIDETLKNDVDVCKKMKVNQQNDEPLYINLEEDKLFNSKLKSTSKQNEKSNENDIPKFDSLKKDKTFLLTKVNIENEQFEINLLNDDNEIIVNKLANIDNEIKEMENQIDFAVEKDKLCVDPENEEQQLITALSNEKIEINGLTNDDLIYGNIKAKDNTDTDDISEICDDFSLKNEELTENLDVRKIGDIELNFDKRDDEVIVNDRSSLYYELINIENKVQKIVDINEYEMNDKNKSKLIESNEIFSSYEKDQEEEEDKTLNSSMVRSGTFNLQPINDCRIETKLKTDFIKNKLTESEDEDSSLSGRIEQDSLMSITNSKIKTTKQQKFDPHQHEKFSKKSLQYFFDESQILAKQQEIDEIESNKSLTNTNKQSSGLFFIELEDPRLNSSLSKSSTFDRKKNKHNQNMVGESSSLNSSFIDDKKSHQKESTDLLPMSMIMRKDNHNNDHGMFRLGNHYKTIGSTSSHANRSTRSMNSSTLNNNLLKKNKSEFTNTSIIQKNDDDDNEMMARKNLFSCTRLGEDLLKLFINQINCDFSLLVSDKSQQLRAHKAILMCRSDFFTKLFTNNIECNQINLTDFSYDSMHFVLCHIYSGAISIPNFNNSDRSKSMQMNNLNSYQHSIEYTELNLAELLSLSDLFQLNILKDVILFEIKKNYCHNFHKPCDDCIIGVINCLNLAQKCELSSLYNASINWITRHYKKIWSTKQFASLFTQSVSIQNSSPIHNHKSKIHQPIHKNNEIINSIYTTMCDGLTNDNVIDRILNLQQLSSSMTRLKWNEMIIRLIEELIEDCCKYLAINYSEIVSSQTFIQLGMTKTWQLDILENYLIMAVDLMKCETAIKVFIHLENIVIMCDAVNENSNNHLNSRESNHIYANTTKNQFSDEFIRTVQKLYKSIERYLIHNANEAVYCESWSDLSSNIQEYIKSSAVLVFEFEKPLAKRPVLSSSLMKSSSRQSSADKSINSVKRKNLEKLKKSKLDKSSDDDQNTLTRKNSGQKNVRITKVDSMSAEHQKKDNYEELHIYDEVPLDLVNEIKEQKECQVEYAKAIKKHSSKNTQQSPQIAKVQPFSQVLPSDLTLSNITTSMISNNYDNYEELEIENNDYENIIYDQSIGLQKVGSESSLASSCLHEAETLEENLQELSRKVESQRVNAIRQCKQQPSQNKKSSSSINNQSNNPNNGSPVLRTGLRSCTRQQSANSISSANSNRPVKASSARTYYNHKKPPFK